VNNPTNAKTEWWVKVQCILGDEAHKYALPWKHMSETTWGKDGATIQGFHHRQVTKLSSSSSSSSFSNFFSFVLDLVLALIPFPC
jgi:hypothetical protein